MDHRSPDGTIHLPQTIAQNEVCGKAACNHAPESIPQRTATETQYFEFGRLYVWFLLLVLRVLGEMLTLFLLVYVFLQMEFQMGLGSARLLLNLSFLLFSSFFLSCGYG